MSNLAREITCTACGKHALIRPEPIYEGFKKTGEAYVCTACGHRYPDAASTPFSAPRQSPDPFSAEKTALRRDPLAGLFETDEPRRHSCLWCRHCVTAAFDQRCGFTNRHTDPLDSCDRFEQKP